MPYAIRKIPNTNLYTVKNQNNGYIHAKGTTKKKAEAQVRLLSLIESNLINKKNK